jgi:hypothetical protein
VARWWRRRRINVIFFCLWAFLFIVFAFVIPPATYGNVILPIHQGRIIDYPISWSYHGSLQISDLLYKVELSASGAFSVQNNITYTITEASPGGSPYPLPNNLTFCCIGFTNASYYPGSQTTLGGNSKATGVITFREAGPIYFFLAKSESAIEKDILPFRVNQDVALVGSPWTITSISDTEASIFNEWAVKFAFIFGSFSILFLAPIFEGIFVRQKDDTN